MHIWLDQYDSKFSMELACVFTKQKIIKTKLISQRVTVNTDTEYFLHVTSNTDAWSTSKCIAGI